MRSIYFLSRMQKSKYYKLCDLNHDNNKCAEMIPTIAIKNIPLQYFNEGAYRTFNRIVTVKMKVTKVTHNSLHGR